MAMKTMVLAAFLMKKQLLRIIVYIATALHQTEVDASKNKKGCCYIT
jgi:hypothetical protein